MNLSLQEEYFNRHNLEIPIVLFKPKSTVFVKTKTQPSVWRIFTTNWRDQDARHPGFYEINYSEAIHNGFTKENGVLLKHICQSERWEWDHYEENILNLTNSLRSSDFVAIHPIEQVLAGWHMFLIMFDQYLSDTMPQEFLHSAVKCLDSNIGLSSRTSLFVTAEKYLRMNQPSVAEIWNCRILPMAKNHSDWLVKLINN